MTFDPEELAQANRERKTTATTPNEPAQRTLFDEPAAVATFEQTAIRLARERAEDSMAVPRRWLARFRGDRQSLAAIAAEDGRDVSTVRAGIDRALRAEGSALAELEERMRRPRPKLGKANLQVIQ